MQAPLSFVLPTARSSGRSTALFDPRRPRGRDPPLCSPPSPAVCTASCSVRQARAHCDASRLFGCNSWARKRQHHLQLERFVVW
ncbi:unnamed protein product [Prorocentrum cordatum]|uniref:Uncharacterized protein n=1 Tax=Prorocentrum cordatum TaxID=2364126 RepID=A0ABN9SM63_9DINO|nr:unnamed protein product [Polarella glacialis]